jgi:protein gp37
MGERTGIEWTDATWSPWEGCTKVGPGCNHCYASAMNRWLRNGENWGPGAPRRQYGPEHWAKPLRWNAAAEKRGRSMRVFPSVCDPFDNEVPAQWREQFFALIRATPHLDWLLLTKRIGNAASMIDAAVSAQPELLWKWPWFNVWLGATVVNQEEADRDIPKLLRVPAHVRFLSCEPLLEAINITAIEWAGNVIRPLCGETLAHDGAVYRGGGRINGVIAGGESGPGARPAHADWFRTLRDQCAAAQVPFFMKQMTKKAPIPDDLMVRQTP